MAPPGADNRISLTPAAWPLADDDIADIIAAVREHQLPEPVRFIGARAPADDDMGEWPDEPCTVVFADAPHAAQAAARETAQQLPAGSSMLSVGSSCANWPDSTHIATTTYGHDVYAAGPCTNVAGPTWWADAHKVVIASPEYEGFMVASFLTTYDIGQLGVTVDAAIQKCVTPQYGKGALLAGQQRGIDLELHTAHIPDEPVSGSITAIDATTFATLASCRLTLASEPLVSCIAESARADGTRIERAAFKAGRALEAGRMSPRGAAASIQRARLTSWAWQGITRRGKREHTAS